MSTHNLPKGAATGYGAGLPLLRWFWAVDRITGGGYLDLQRMSARHLRRTFEMLKAAQGLVQATLHERHSWAASLSTGELSLLAPYQEARNLAVDRADRRRGATREPWQAAQTAGEAGEEQAAADSGRERAREATQSGGARPEQRTVGC